MKRGRRKSPAVVSADQLGTIDAVARYMRVSRTWLSGVKRRWVELSKAKAIGGKPPFVGGKTCSRWVLEFMRRPENAEFSPSAAYRKAPPSPRPGPVL